jgi:hypothetical protein
MKQERALKAKKNLEKINGIFSNIGNADENK